MSRFKDIREINKDTTKFPIENKDSHYGNPNDESVDNPPVYDKLNKCYMEED